MPAVVDEPGIAKDVEVLRDCGNGGDVEVAGDVTGRQLIRADKREDLPPPRLGDRPKRCFHDRQRVANA